MVPPDPYLSHFQLSPSSLISSYLLQVDAGRTIYSLPRRSHPPTAPVTPPATAWFIRFFNLRFCPQTCARFGSGPSTRRRRNPVATRTTPPPLPASGTSWRTASGASLMMSGTGTTSGFSRSAFYTWAAAHSLLSLSCHPLRAAYWWGLYYCERWCRGTRFRISRGSSGSWKSRGSARRILCFTRRTPCLLLRVGSWWRPMKSSSWGSPSSILHHSLSQPPIILGSRRWQWRWFTHGDMCGELGTRSHLID